MSSHECFVPGYTNVTVGSISGPMRVSPAVLHIYTKKKAAGKQQKELNSNGTLQRRLSFSLRALRQKRVSHCPTRRRLLSIKVSYTEQEKIEMRPQLLPILFIACPCTALLREPCSRKLAERRLRCPLGAISGREDRIRLFSRAERRASISLVAVDALALKRQAEALRAEARSMERSMNEVKAERERDEKAKVDGWINDLLVNVTIDDSTQMLNTEERVARLLQDRRFSAEHVNKMFNRICELSQRQQSIDSCSPLISLLLDAACRVDCLEREDNPNKRWNHRVERDLRKKLFAMGCGINLDEVKSKDRVRALTGEKDIF